MSLEPSPLLSKHPLPCPHIVLVLGGSQSPPSRHPHLGRLCPTSIIQETSCVYFVPTRICSPSLDLPPGYLSDLPTLSLGQERLIIHLISQAQKVASKWPKYLDHSTTSELILVVLKADAEATWLLLPAVSCQQAEWLGSSKK